MNCFYCNGEMEKGWFVAAPSQGMMRPYLGYIAEKEFEKKGIIGFFKRKSIRIKESSNSRGYEAFHCLQCNKVFAELPTVDSDDAM